MNISYSYLTDKGLKRTENQDKITAHAGGGYALFAVADGMGGHSDGQYASAEIIAGLDEWWFNSTQNKISGDFTSDVDSLRNCINAAHTRISEYSKLKGIICGTTLSLLYIYDKKYIAMNIGDSPIITLNGKSKEQLSIEHNHSNILKKSGIIVDNGSQKLTQAVGVKELIYPNVRTGNVTDKQSFLICSDGISKYADYNRLFKLLKKLSIGKINVD